MLIELHNMFNGHLSVNIALQHLIQLKKTDSQPKNSDPYQIGLQERQWLLRGLQSRNRLSDQKLVPLTFDRQIFHFYRLCNDIFDFGREYCVLDSCVYQRWSQHYISSILSWPFSIYKQSSLTGKGPGMFQRVIDVLRREVQRQCTLAYFDFIELFSHKVDDNNDFVRQFLALVQDARGTQSINNTSFSLSKTTYLEYSSSHTGQSHSGRYVFLTGPEQLTTATAFSSFSDLYDVFPTFAPSFFGLCHCIEQ